MSCCSGCARWIIGIISACVLICAVVAAVYVYYKERNEDWSELVKNNIPFWFLVFAACCAIVTSIIGFILCCCHSKCIYITYLVIIIIVILVEIAGIVLAFCYKDKILDGIDENWYMEKYKNTRLDIEKKLKCCGFKEYKEFQNCGAPDSQGKEKDFPTCEEDIKDGLNKRMKQLRICIIVMACIELILLICASYLACCNKEDYEIK